MSKSKLNDLWRSDITGGEEVRYTLPIPKNPISALGRRL